MVPALFVTLAALPRTPNGKVDRKALPAPERERAGDAPQVAAPETELERAIAEIWRELLGTAQVGVHDNFFDLGGHSLLAVEVMAKTAQRTGVKLNPAVLRNLTLGQVAALCQEQQAGTEAPSEPEEPEGLGNRLRGMVRRVIDRQS
jgi:acyl carrier protein